MYAPGTTQEQAKAFEAFVAADQRRVVHEWAKWGGSAQEAEKINDAQCARLNAARDRLGMPL